MTRKCAVPNCPTNVFQAEKKHIILFRTPQNPESLEKWKLNLPFLTSESLLCEKHFLKRDILKSDQGSDLYGTWWKVTLKPGAVPIGVNSTTTSDASHPSLPSTSNMINGTSNSSSRKNIDLDEAFTFATLKENVKSIKLPNERWHSFVAQDVIGFYTRHKDYMTRVVNIHSNLSAQAQIDEAFIEGIQLPTLRTLNDVARFLLTVDQQNSSNDLKELNSVTTSPGSSKAIAVEVSKVNLVLSQNKDIVPVVSAVQHVPAQRYTVSTEVSRVHPASNQTKVVTLRISTVNSGRIQKKVLSRVSIVQNAPAQRYAVSRRIHNVYPASSKMKVVTPGMSTVNPAPSQQKVIASGFSTTPLASVQRFAVPTRIPNVYPTLSQMKVVAPGIATVNPVSNQQKVIAAGFPTMQLAPVQRYTVPTGVSRVHPASNQTKVVTPGISTVNSARIQKKVLSRVSIVQNAPAQRYAVSPRIHNVYPASSKKKVVTPGMSTVNPASSQQKVIASGFSTTPLASVQRFAVPTRIPNVYPASNRRKVATPEISTLNPASSQKKLITSGVSTIRLQPPQRCAAVPGVSNVNPVPSQSTPPASGVSNVTFAQSQSNAISSRVLHFKRLPSHSKTIVPGVSNVCVPPSVTNTRNETIKTSLCQAVESRDVNMIKKIISLGLSVDTHKPHSLTPLLVAIEKNSIGIVTLLVDNGADIHLDTKFGKPFAYAAAWGRTNLLSYFLRKGVDVNERNKNGDTALHALCKHRHCFDRQQTFMFLLQHGADVNAKNSENKPPLSYTFVELKRLHEKASWKLESEEMKNMASALNLISAFLSRGADLDDDMINCPLFLHRAILLKNLTLIEYLCKRSKIIDKEFSYESEHSSATKTINPLQLAIEGDINIVKILVDDGASVEHTNELGNIIEYALGKRNYEALDYFLCNGVDINRKNKDGNTFVHLLSGPGYYSNYGPKNLQDVLLKHGASLEELNAEGKTPLQLAIQNNKDEVAKFLLDNGADVEHGTKHGRPFHLAALKSRQIMEYIVEKGVDINEKNAQGETALHLICQDIDNSSLRACTFLLNRGADVNAVDDEKNTPLFYASQVLFSPNKEAPVSPWNYRFVHLKDKLHVIHELINRGADLNITLSECQLILHLAVANADQNLIDCLLKRNVEVDSRTEKGLTALHYAALADDVSILSSLLRHGADVNAVMSKRLTALHIAALKGHSMATAALLNFGANIDAQDDWGRTPLYIAARSKKDVISTALLLRGANTEIKNIYGATAYDVISISQDVFLHAQDRDMEKNTIYLFENQFEISKNSYNSNYMSMHFLRNYDDREDGTKLMQKIFNRCQRLRKNMSRILNMKEEELLDILKGDADFQLAQEVLLMRKTKVFDDSTLYDIATKHPREMAKNFGVMDTPDCTQFSRLGYYYFLQERVNAIMRIWAGYELGQHLEIKLPEEMIEKIIFELNLMDVKNILKATVNYKKAEFNGNKEASEEARKDVNCITLSQGCSSDDDDDSEDEDDGETDVEDEENYYDYDSCMGI